MNKKVVLSTALFAFGGIIATSCGGGGGGSLSTSTSTTVSGAVQSSLVKGAEVCVNGTDNCAITNDNGTFTLKVPKLPVTLEVKVGNLPIGTVDANSTYVPVNPLTLTNGDLALAPVVRAVIHALAGDTSGNATVIDLSKVKIKVSTDKPLVEILKSSNQTVDIPVETDNGSLNVTLSGGVVEVNDKPVEVNTGEADLQLWALEQFLSQSDGKTVTFVDANGNKVAICKLDAEAPNLVKLEDCSNPDWNSDGWATVTKDENTGKVAIKTPDGQYYDLVSLDPSGGVICYSDNGEQYCAYISSENPTEDQTKVEYAKLINFLDARNGKIVNVEDSEGGTATCTFVVNPAANNQFALVNCNPNDFNSDEWTKVEDEKTADGWKVEGDIQGYITSLDTNNNQISLKIYDDDLNKWITATLYFTDQNGVVVYPTPINDLTQFGIYGKINYDGEIPSDWKIRITPANEQVDGQWGGVICQINPDGSFGQRCEVHGDIEDFTKDTTYQVIVFEDQNYDWHWEANEPSVFGMENATFGSWQTIDLNNETANGTSQEVNTQVTPSDFVIQNYSQSAVDSALQSLNGKNVAILPNTQKVSCEATYQNGELKLSDCSISDYDTTMRETTDDNGYIHLGFNNTSDWDDFLIFYANDGIVCGYSLHYGDVNCLVDTSKIPQAINDSDLQGDWKVSEHDLKQWIPGTFTFEDGSLGYNGTKLADYSIGDNAIDFSNQASNFDASRAIVLFELSPTEWLVQEISTDNDATLHVMQKQ